MVFSIFGATQDQSMLSAFFDTITDRIIQRTSRLRGRRYICKPVCYCIMALDFLQLYHRLARHRRAYSLFSAVTTIREPRSSAD